MIDIQAGDVVVCVNSKPMAVPDFFGLLDALKTGALYRVEWLVPPGPSGIPGVKLCGLPLTPMGTGYRIDRFRKVRKATDEFTAQIKAIRPIREDA